MQGPHLLFIARPQLASADRQEPGNPQTRSGCGLRKHERHQACSADNSHADFSPAMAICSKEARLVSPARPQRSAYFSRYFCCRRIRLLHRRYGLSQPSRLRFRVCPIRFSPAKQQSAEKSYGICPIVISNIGFFSQLANIQSISFNGVMQKFRIPARMIRIGTFGTPLTAFGRQKQ